MTTKDKYVTKYNGKKKKDWEYLTEKFGACFMHNHWVDEIISCSNNMKSFENFPISSVFLTNWDSLSFFFLKWWPEIGELELTTFVASWSSLLALLKIDVA